MMSAGDLVALSDSVGDIDTSDKLVMFEAFQKVFVVNGANLKVADFVNTKLTHGALATPHAKGDTLTQATSNAVMIVDFTNAAKTATYGYVTSGTFDATHEVTGDGSGSAFTPSAVTNNPHWYDWTPYQNDTTTYGTMPEKAYLGCLYRGRCVLAGNPNYPYQWYMSEVADPWNWAYGSNDALSPIYGGAGKAGELGDIVRALIPYQDEYLLFGCANSIWALRGDPADGGSLTPLNETIGVFGNQSWCFDSGMNLFFTSKNGIHRIPYGFGPVENISQFVLPNLIEDTALDPTQHLVVMGYDRERDGILISITTIADGTNVNYWYDLNTKGFYLEEYPTVCGVYSMYFYSANDDTYRKLLLGSTDGFIRTFDKDTTNDATTNGTQAISSELLLPILETTEADDTLKINDMSVVTAGGSAGGSENDTNSVTIEIFTNDDAEAVLEAVEDGDTPLHTDTITGPGRANRLRNRTRGKAIGIKLSNSDASSTWSIERISANINQV